MVYSSMLLTFFFKTWEKLQWYFLICITLVTHMVKNQIKACQIKTAAFYFTAFIIMEKLETVTFFKTHNLQASSTINFCHIFCSHSSGLSLTSASCVHNQIFLKKLSLLFVYVLRNKRALVMHLSQLWLQMYIISEHSNIYPAEGTNLTFQ